MSPDAVFLNARQIKKKKSEKARGTRDAGSIIKNWRRSLVSTPACPINTVAGLAGP